MLEDQMVLWKHRLTKDVENGNNGSIKPDEIMHESLSGLVHFLRNDRRRWSIARVVCGKYDVMSPLDLPHGEYDGWYTSLREIPLRDGFFPVADAKEKYAAYLK